MAYTRRSSRRRAAPRRTTRSYAPRRATRSRGVGARRQSTRRSSPRTIRIVLEHVGASTPAAGAPGVAGMPGVAVGPVVRTRSVF